MLGHQQNFEHRSEYYTTRRNTMRYTRHVSNLALKSRKFKEASPEEKQLKKIKTKRKYIYA